MNMLQDDNEITYYSVYMPPVVHVQSLVSFPL